MLALGQNKQSEDSLIKINEDYLIISDIQDEEEQARQDQQDKQIVECFEEIQENLKGQENTTFSDLIPKDSQRHNILRSSLQEGNLTVEIAEPKIAYENPLNLLTSITPKLKPYKLYPLQCFINGEKLCQVERRFSDFEFLSEILSQNYPYLIVPVNPEKNIWANWGLESKESEDSRKSSLRYFLQKLLKNNQLRNSIEFLSFLNDSEDVYKHLITDQKYKISQINDEQGYISSIFTSVSGWFTGQSIPNQLEGKNIMDQDKNFNNYQSIVYKFKSKVQALTQNIQTLSTNINKQSKRSHQLIDILEGLFANVTQEKLKIMSKVIEEAQNRISQTEERFSSFLNLILEINLKEIAQDIQGAFEYLERRKLIPIEIGKLQNKISEMKNWKCPHSDIQGVEERIIQLKNLINIFDEYIEKEIETFRIQCVLQIKDLMYIITERQKLYAQEVHCIWEEAYQNIQKSNELIS